LEAKTVFIFSFFLAAAESAKLAILTIDYIVAGVPQADIHSPLMAFSDDNETIRSVDGYIDKPVCNFYFANTVFVSGKSPTSLRKQ
jgi:hypothetical protein